MVRKAEKNDLELLADLAVQLWDSHSAKELVQEFSELISSGEAQFYMKFINDMPVGFAQCQLRHDYVEGTRTTPVGYLEGIFVKEEYRRRGYAGELLAACEGWAKANSCQEFASDCELDNMDSFLFHKAMRFTEANRIVCFAKTL